MFSLVRILDVFICTFDPFDFGKYQYTFEESCKEVNLVLGDGTRKIFLNTKGKYAEDVPDVLLHFLKYVENSTDQYVAQVEDAMLKKLHTKVKDLKGSRKLEEKYMQFEELLKREHSEGLAEGLAEGVTEGNQQMLNLICSMIANGRAADVPRLREDAMFREEMIARYQKL
ncbi:MAG: hypothetical protein RR995_00505 [Hungatella sp.]